jgi:ubiquinone/menaquinone biosynthesis C-methylase UbiE
LDVIADIIPLAGARVVDVGCGEGALARALAKRGAHVTGVEILDEALSKARAAAPVAGERFLKGVGEDLPLPDNDADAVIFLNSLHHVPGAHMDKALREAARVLKPGGIAIVHEPEPTGGYFELTKLVDDETEVRAQAHAAIKAVRVLESADELFYFNPVRLDDYEGFANRMAGVDPTRSTLIRDRDAELRALFDSVAERREGAFWFDQPIRVNLLRKPTP